MHASSVRSIAILNVWSWNISGFTYCKSIKVANGVKLPSNANGCDCRGSCIASRTCSCAKLNGLDFPYVHRDGGRSGFH